MLRTPIFLFCVFIWQVSWAEEAVTKISLSTTYTPLLSKEQKGDGMLELWYKEVFKQLGMSVDVQARSAELTLRHANAGIDDGTGPRIAGLEKKYPNLVMVPEAVLEQHFVAFTLAGKELEIQNWDSLEPYKTGVVKGHKILEKNIPKAVRLNNPKALFSALERGMIDAAVINNFIGVTVGREVIGAKKFSALSPALIIKPMYLYLHKRHADSAEKAAAVMRELKENGTYAEIMKLDEVLRTD